MCLFCYYRKLVHTVDLKPPVRLKEFYSRVEDVRRQAELAPCGNFTAVYRCLCDYHGIDFMEDVAWVSFAHFCRYLPLLYQYIFHKAQMELFEFRNAFCVLYVLCVICNVI